MDPRTGVLLGPHDAIAGAEPVSSFTGSVSSRATAASRARRSARSHASSLARNHGSEFRLSRDICGKPAVTGTTTRRRCPSSGRWATTPNSGPRTATSPALSTASAASASMAASTGSTGTRTTTGRDAARTDTPGSMAPVLPTGRCAQRRSR
ncbi:hypothetical protein FRZ03_09495 [Streptomyces misionensis]|uniref:Uncharacterized protein n=1 Tax=Streptomyces misionensis TaxID=67331 RepID=A0A5C6JWK9_9ACTN|nr:hypothetical protein FRZ03_09495 [Streptomyces misionensis]